jgi:protein-tyrosine-phosphatase/DNA-binding transcriptional ArsR family regulator
MELTNQLQALAHDTRLAVFQLLMRRYPQQVPSGDIAAALGLKANTCSVHLATLARAGLIASERVGTQVRYRVGMGSVGDMMLGLTRECCNGRPDLCAPEMVFPSSEATEMHRAPFHVLFICTGNSARSIMAEAILNAEGKGKFIAHSAGTQPGKAPHPRVLSLLADKGLDSDGLRSKSTEEFSGPDAPKLDFVFTVCDHAANERCPLWPGQPLSAHWGLADPTKATGSAAEVALAFQHAYGTLRNRISAFAALPIATLSRISLQHAIDDIGRQKAPS